MIEAVAGATSNDELREFMAATSLSLVAGTLPGFERASRLSWIRLHEIASPLRVVGPEVGGGRLVSGGLVHAQELLSDVFPRE